jgi:U5 snRNP spliceosome subunit
MAYATSEDMGYRRKRGKGEDKSRAPKLDDILTQLIDWATATNVAEDLDAEKLDRIGDRVVREYQIDEDSRADWLAKAKRSLDRSKMVQEAKSWPFDGASNIKYPLLTIASLQFAARAYTAIVDGSKIVKGQVIGDDPEGVKRSKADRVATHMSYQLLTEMPEWEDDTDTLLHQLPIVGCAFRKVFRDPGIGRNRSEMVSATDLVVNQKTKSMETVPRITQIFTLYPHEIEERVADGIFLDVELGCGTSGDLDDDAPETFLEQHRWLDLNGDGFREPWIVTVHKDTSKVVRIVANYDPEAITFRQTEDKKGAPKLGRLHRKNIFVMYPFFRDPAGGFYALGFGELLDTISEVIDGTLNMLMDAGHLQNAGGGFIGSGLRLKKSQIRLSPGEYKVVDAPGGKVREAIYNMEHPGPSPVLFQVLGMMVEAGNKIASISEIMSGEMPRNQPATTTLAMIEQGMKVYTSIYKRIFRALKKEYGLIFELNARNLSDDEYFVILDNRKAVAKDDYELGAMDIVPQADPTMVTDAQRMMRGQAIMEAANTPAGQAIVKPHEAYRRYFETIGVEDPENLINPPPPPPPPPGSPPPPQEQAAMRGLMAEVSEKEAKAAKTAAETEKVQAETEKTRREAAQMDDAGNFGKEMDDRFKQLMGGGKGEEPEEDEDEAGEQDLEGMEQR